MGGNLDPGAQLLTFGKYMGQSFESVYDTDPSYITWCSSQLSGNGNSNQAKFLAYIARRFSAEEAEEAGLGAERPGEALRHRLPRPGLLSSASAILSR